MPGDLSGGGFSGGPVLNPSSGALAGDWGMTLGRAGRPGQGWFAQEVLPWLTSLLLHILVLAVGYLGYRVAVHVVNQRSDLQVNVPDALGPEMDAARGLPHAGHEGDPTRPTLQNRIIPSTGVPKGLSEEQGDMRRMLMDGGGQGAQRAPGVIGQGFGLGDGNGEGNGRGDGKGDGAGRSALTPFGAPEGDSRSFLQVPAGTARRIVFVCDASGSMTPKFDLLRREITRTLAQYNSGISFNLIFFGGDPKTPRALSTTDLLFAGSENKRKAADFLEKVAPSGSTYVLPALDLAFRQKPELVYLLTDGEFDSVGNDNAAVMQWLASHNADKKVKVCTIAFMAEAADEQVAKVLGRIAKENGGVFKAYTGDQ